jgi:succinoglycan biosynthesis protein ExoM
MTPPLPVEGTALPSAPLPHVTVCVATFRRPAMLARLIAALELLRTDGRFTYSVVIVDNDRETSAREVAEEARSRCAFPVTYLTESEQNIALARNKGVEHATGTHAAFIDDDEWPDPDWLILHLRTLSSLGADGSFGPILPHFDSPPPRWLVEGGFCLRRSFETGTVLESTACRTGNALVSLGLFRPPGHRFDPRFGRSGGEDGQFFLRMISLGCTFVWCDEAPVHELVPPERWKPSYYIRRQVRIGGATGDLARRRGLREDGWETGKAVLRAHAYALVLVPAVIVSLALPKSTRVKCQMKLGYFLSLALGFWGLVLIREKKE